MPQQVGDPIAEAAQVQEQVFILIHIKGIKIVLFQVTAPLQAPLPVLATQKTEPQQNGRGEHVDREFCKYIHTPFLCWGLV
jgi:hypothetical protein